MVGRRKKNKSGTILIIALWSLSLLVTFTLILGATVKQRIKLLSRLEDRNKLHLIAESGIKKAIAVLFEDALLSGDRRLIQAKINRYNNEKQLATIELNSGVAEVSYEYPDNLSRRSQKRFGITNEEGKININKAGTDVLKALIKNVLGGTEEDVSRLALAIIDWREPGESELKGFFSDEYYSNLEYPYAPKNANFEVIDELLLVKGINEEVLNALLPYITVYGQGKVNINTASKIVLLSIGFSESLVDAILSVRQGADGVEATGDDFIFQDIYNLAGELQQSVKLTAEEIQEIRDFSDRGKLGVDSHFYFIRSKAKLNKGNTFDIISCIFNKDEQKIEYWKENFEASLQ